MSTAQQMQVTSCGTTLGLEAHGLASLSGKGGGSLYGRAEEGDYPRL